MTIVTNGHYEEYDVYIGRGSMWGNPYSHREGTLALYRVESVEQAISRYREHLWNQIREGTVTLDDLRQLDGKRLGCYCKPRPCHGDVIKSAVEWAVKRKPNVPY